MPLSPSDLRLFVNRALISATGVTDPDRAQLSAAFTVLCDRLRQRLEPIFGTPAITALFTRALHLAGQQYPWLNELRFNSARCSLEGFESAHRELDNEEVGAALGALLGHDIGLLTAFIGEDMVLPLVQDAWADAVITNSGPATGKGEQ
jgi:hypothetical protein